MDYSFLSSPCAAALYGLMLKTTDNGKMLFEMPISQMEKAVGYSTKQVRNAIQKLISCGVVQGQFKGQGKGHISTFVIALNIATCKSKILQKGSFKGSFNDTNKAEINTQFETLWEAYKHKGSKKVALERWTKLTDDERSKVLVHAPLYRNSRLAQYTKALEAYLNQRTWESAITTDYQEEIPLDARAVTAEQVDGFIDWYNRAVDGTLIRQVQVLTEERQVLLNIDLMCFGNKAVANAVVNASRDPVNTGARPLQANQHVATFEEIMHPNNVKKTIEN